MKYIIGVLIIITCTIATGTLFAQTVTTVPTDTKNDRFLEEYHNSIIRPGLSLNGFDNTGSTSQGLGLKQVLNLAFAGDPYINDKLDEIFDDANNSLQTNNPTNEQIQENSRILQYTAFEALASYVLYENGIRISNIEHSTLKAEVFATNQFKFPAINKERNLL